MYENPNTHFINKTPAMNNNLQVNSNNDKYVMYSSQIITPSTSYKTGGLEALGKFVPVSQ